MTTTRFAVTYAVTFERNFFYQGIYYYPGIAYHFTVLSESDHPGDVFDDAYDDYCQRFDCIDGEGHVITENFKPLVADPVVKEVKAVMLPAAGETEADLETGKKEALLIIAPKRAISAGVRYNAPEDLVSSVNELLMSEETPFDFAAVADDAVIRMPECDGGGAYPWNTTLAHYCFGKGRISETRLVEELFKRENRLPDDTENVPKEAGDAASPEAGESENKNELCL